MKIVSLICCIVIATLSAPAQTPQVIHLNVNASSQGWTSLPTSLAPGQTATVKVLRRPDGRPQTWGVIDPHNRGENDITGNGVKAGPNFVLPGGMEGALLVRDGNGSPHAFTSIDQQITLTTPGKISFIANDEGACNSAPCHPLICFGCGPAKNGFTDNVGWIEVVITITGP
jgi:hypothetical protein